MPHRLDLQERAQSGRARRCCKVRNALGNVYPLDRLGCGLLEGLTQGSIRTGEIEGIDIRVSREVRSKLRDPSRQDVDHSTGYIRHRYYLSKGDCYAGILLGSDHQT